MFKRLLCRSLVPLAAQLLRLDRGFSRSGADWEIRARLAASSAPSAVLAPSGPFPSPRTLSTEIGARLLTYTKLWDVEGMEEERKNNQTEAAISVEAGATTRDTGASRGARMIVHTSSSRHP